MTLLADAPMPLTRIRQFVRRHPYKLVMPGVLILYAVIAAMMLGGGNAGAVQFRVDFSPLLRISAVLQAHIAGAVLSFLIGAVLLLGVKGRTVHRVLGYIWIVSMGVTAISSFWLTGMNGSSFSVIHLLSGWTVIMLPMGLAAARRRNIAQHRKTMTGIFMGGMLIAGLFTFLPGRLMWHLFFAA